MCDTRCPEVVRREMDVHEVVAREQIREVISRYNHAGDRGRLEELAQCFAERGVLDLEDAPPVEGRDAVRTHLAGVVARLAQRTTTPVLRHHVSSIHIEVTGSDSAVASSYFLVFTEAGLDHWGRYGDRFVRESGEWRIASRRVRIDGASPESRMVASPGSSST